MKIQFLGHACFIIETNGKRLIIDPFITPNPKASHIDVDKLVVDYILLTHGHMDHVADVERIVSNNPGVTIISGFEIVEYYGAKGVKGHPMNHGGKWKFDFGTLIVVNAVHSSVMPDGTYAGNPMGFVINNDDANIYIAGDTALTMDMKLIPLLSKPLNLSILPIGSNFTMDYDAAVLASDFVECNKVLGCHFDTFPYIEIEQEAAKSAFTKKNKELILINVGDHIKI